LGSISYEDKAAIANYVYAMQVNSLRGREQYHKFRLSLCRNFASPGGIGIKKWSPRQLVGLMEADVFWHEQASRRRRADRIH
jgi:hypothetical protein